MRSYVRVPRFNGSQSSNGVNAWKICIAGVSKRVVDWRARTHGGNRIVVS